MQRARKTRCGALRCSDRLRDTIILTALAASAILFLPAQCLPEAGLANDQCFKCHGEAWIASMRPQALAAMVRIPREQSPVFRPADKVRFLYTPEDLFNASAHAGLKCTDCHRGIESLPHDQRLAVLSCGDCHAEVEEIIAKGPHRPGAPDENIRPRPTCADCHGATHEIVSLKSPRTYEKALDIVSSCERCHDTNDSLPFNPAKTYTENVHGEALLKKGLPLSATCIDCHGHHAVLPPTNPESPISPLRVPKTCGKCHQGIKEVFLTSVHGKLLLEKDQNAATCTSCHASHGIVAITPPFLLAVVKECSHCHIELGASYLRSYHGKATTLGDRSAAVCSSCHGAHNILPPSDPKSQVAPGNLQKTCGKCHEGINANFVKYITHVNYRDRKANPQVYYVWLGMTALLLSVLSFFIVHTVLWFQRSLLGRLITRESHMTHPRSDRQIQRFHPVHRVTHYLIIVSFMGLVATGFPLKYSYAQWAQDLASVLGGVHTMRIIHRILAITTFTYAGLHVGFLAYFFAFRCPRPRIKYLIGPDSMLFSFRDLKEFLRMVAWFLWLKPKPKFDRWTYFEKFDYWGEIWGVIVIGGTGLMLWMPMLFTRWLPGWVLNCAVVVHSIEALLAASIIFLVHFFNTHLRPDKFPIDLVMMTGQMSETEFKEERAEQYERLAATGELDKLVVQPVAQKWRLLLTVLGIAALLFGIILIVLALKTQLTPIL
jgi:cytochrome b subunit of formate dehydrogenase